MILELPYYVLMFFLVILFIGVAWEGLTRNRKFNKKKKPRQ